MSTMPPSALLTGFARLIIIAMRCPTLGESERPVFFVFSDDMEWVKAELKPLGRFIFVDHNNVENGFEDLRLISRCRHQVIANSSFSWWERGQSRFRKIVVAPRKWFNQYAGDTRDLYPEGWITI